MESSIKKILILFLTGCLWALSTLAYAVEIKAAVLKDTDNFLITARGAYTIKDSATNKVYINNRRLPLSKVEAVNGKIVIGKNLFNSTHIKITTAKDISIYFKDKRRKYRNCVEIILQKNGKLLVINALDVESYVRGVLYHEISDKWPIEAMKAQAVATRTYALYQIKKNAQQPFHVTSDIYSQVYGGRSAEKFRTDLACDKTSGQVLTYQGKIIPAYFHSNSGGYTEDASELWEHNLLPLKGREDKFAIGTPHYNWKRNFRLKDIQEKLNANGKNLGLIKEIRVVERNKSGRVKYIEIETRDGKIKKMTAKEFRDIVGPNDIKSNMYEIIMQGYYMDVIGKGWGHGVGLCQWGAYNMSRQRYKYNDILKFYYPGVTITDYTQIKSFL